MRPENDRPIRLIDIAHRARVSYTAVAHVLRGSAGPRAKVSRATAERIQRIATELGYAPREIVARPVIAADMPAASQPGALATDPMG
jgi:DNA-binding LacI/PurR family transcriptional regulator